MESIQIVGTGSYLPKRKITSNEIEQEFQLPKGYIFSRCGILERYYVETETIVDLATMATKNLLGKSKIKSNEIEMILVASTSSKEQMPGISYQVQKDLGISSSICLDIAGGCSGYINAFDMARNYIAMGIVENALIIGVDLLSPLTEEIGTKMLLADGAGATLITKAKESKLYYSYLESNGIEGKILTYQIGKTIKMRGKEIYRYAVTKTVENVETVLKKAGESVVNLSYFIPHQSNQKIMDSIIKRLKIPKEKMMSNIQKVGNTFCASIPIVLDENFTKIGKGEKILLLGYGGGLNTGSILLEK